MYVYTSDKQSSLAHARAVNFEVKYFHSASSFTLSQNGYIDILHLHARMELCNPLFLWI